MAGKRKKELYELTAKDQWRLHKEKYFLIMPFAALFLVFTLIPVLTSIILSFTSFNMLEMPDFVGLKNYVNLIAFDSVFLIAVKNTLLFAIVTGPVSYLLCFVLAWIINDFPPKVRAVLTLVFYAPSISGNAYAVIKIILSSDAYGFFNALLVNWGIIDGPKFWLEDKDLIMPVLLIVQLWLSLGVSFLAFIAGLQNVDKTLYEAGAVDGVKNRWQQLWYITLPQMKPQLMFGAVMQITSSLSVSGISLDLVGFPSTEYRGHTILTHLHDFGNLRYEMGTACAIAAILFFIMLFTNIIVQKLLRKVAA